MAQLIAGRTPSYIMFSKLTTLEESRYLINASNGPFGEAKRCELQYSSIVKAHHSTSTAKPNRIIKLSFQTLPNPPKTCQNLSNMPAKSPPRGIQMLPSIVKANKPSNAVTHLPHPGSALVVSTFLLSTHNCSPLSEVVAQADGLTL